MNISHRKPLKPPATEEDGTAGIFAVRVSSTLARWEACNIPLIIPEPARSQPCCFVGFDSSVRRTAPIFKILRIINSWGQPTTQRLRIIFFTTGSICTVIGAVLCRVPLILPIPSGNIRNSGAQTRLPTGCHLALRTFLLYPAASPWLSSTLLSLRPPGMLEKISAAHVPDRGWTEWFGMPCRNTAQSGGDPPGTLLNDDMPIFAEPCYKVCWGILVSAELFILDLEKTDTKIAQLIHGNSIWACRMNRAAHKGPLIPQSLIKKILRSIKVVVKKFSSFAH
jgi:hypothetical protein